MNAHQTHAIAIRTANLLASVAVAALIVGSQFGIADGYTQQADAVLTAKSVQEPVAQHTAASAQPRTQAAEAGAALAFGHAMPARSGTCLCGALASLGEGRDGRPEQHQRADTPCQRG
jgi:hypothetical protein